MWPDLSTYKAQLAKLTLTQLFYQDKRIGVAEDNLEGQSSQFQNYHRLYGELLQKELDRRYAERGPEWLNGWPNGRPRN